MGIGNGVARDDLTTDAALRTYKKARQAAIHAYALKAFEKTVADYLAKLATGVT